MDNKFFITLNKLFKGQSLARIEMNIALSHHAISGRVLDVGGGRNPDYFTYIDTSKMVSCEAIDASISSIDFEADPLPYSAGSVDTVLLCNVLEHIYNYNFLLSETYRLLTPNGKLLGFVPFWVGYHPDPHDYFRYTHEALMRMLSAVGYVEVEITPIRVTPIFASFNSIVLSLPRILRPVAYVLCVPLEMLLAWFRPGIASRHPLGFVFTARHDA